MIFLQAGMGVPSTRGPITVLNLNETHSALRQTPGNDELPSEGLGHLLIETV